MANTIFLAGVPGVGKTTLLMRPKIFKKLQREKYTLIGMGDVMFKIALDEELVEDRDDMRSLDRETQSDIQERAALQINDEYVQKNKNILVDTHVSILTPTGYISTLATWVADSIDIDYLAYLESNPENILQRREKDSSRRRNALINEIIEHQDFNRNVVAAYTTFSRTARAVFIDNSDGKEEQAENKLIGIL